jgi:integrase
MVRLQLLTGMRPGEVCSMKYADIRRSGSTWLFMPTNHKTAHLGEDRLIYVGKEAQAILIKYDYRPPEDFCFSPADRLRQGGREPVIGGREVGDRYHTRTYRQAIWRACDKAGIDRWAPNRIRKTNANNVRRVGGLEAAQVVLGHKSRTTTEKFYADIDTSKAIEVMEKIG